MTTDYLVMPPIINMLFLNVNKLRSVVNISPPAFNK
jgi:hypothetical protein